MKEAAKRIRKQKAAGKPKPKPKAKKKAPDPADPHAAQADTPDAPEPDQATDDDDPLLVEVHAAVDEVAKEARLAGRLDEVTPTLELVARGFRFRAQRLRDGLPLK